MKNWAQIHQLNPSWANFSTKKRKTLRSNYLKYCDFLSCRQFSQQPSIERNPKVSNALLIHDRKFDNPKIQNNSNRTKGKGNSPLEDCLQTHWGASRFRTMEWESNWAALQVNEGRRGRYGRRMLKMEYSRETLKHR